MNSNFQPDCDLRHLLGHAFPSSAFLHEEGWTIYPSSTQEVATAVQIARRCGCSVTVTPPQIRRRATGNPCSSQPPLYLCLDRMSSIISIDETSLAAEVQVGIAVRDLMMVLSDHGLTSGFIPVGNDDSKLIDFVVGRCACESSMLYGRPNQAYMGSEGVLPGGEIFKIKPAPARAVGPDLLGLLVSCHGELCIVTSLVIRLWRQPKVRELIVVSYGEMREALCTAAMVARSIPWLAAGRIYCPRWSLAASCEGREETIAPETGGRGTSSCIAVFVLEGEAATVDVTASAVRKIVDASGGTILPPKHHLSTVTVRLPRSFTHTGCNLIMASVDWAAAADLYEEVQSRLNGQLLGTKVSDFFHEGCLFSWAVRQPESSISHVEEALGRFGGNLLSGHLISTGETTRPSTGTWTSKKLESIKAALDPDGTIV